MNILDVEVGMVVTWGSGSPRGKVTEVDPDRDEPVCVVLLAPQEGLCGRPFPVGTKGWFSAEELSLIQ